jgi:hypothetical protein
MEKFVVEFSREVCKWPFVACTSAVASTVNIVVGHCSSIVYCSLHDFRNPVVFACSSYSYCYYAFTRLKLIFVLLSAF